MNHNDDFYATLLLVSSILPDRGELAVPMNSEEWHALRKLLRDRNIRLGEMINMDMSEMMIRLGLSEEETYRIFLLISRTTPMTIALEKFAMRGITELTYPQGEYPDKLRRRLRDSAPPMFYLCGRPEIFKQDAIAILGAVKPLGNVKDEIAKLVKLAVNKGYVIVTDGTLGISRIARDEAIALAGKVIEVLPGELGDRIDIPDTTAAIAKGELTVISTEHPDKKCELSAAHSRNKIIYALSQAAFIFGVERNSGAVWMGAGEAIKKRWCPRVYAWDTDVYADNSQLIRMGAAPFESVTPEGFDVMRDMWLSDSFKQLRLFGKEERL